MCLRGPASAVLKAAMCLLLLMLSSAASGMPVRILLISSHSGGPANWVTKQSFLIENMLEFYGVPYDLFDIGVETLDQETLDMYQGVILEGYALRWCATEAERSLIATNMEGGAITALLSIVHGEYTELNPTIYAALDVEVDGQGNSEANIQVNEGASIIFDYSGEEGFVISGGYEGSHVAIASHSLGSWTTLNPYFGAWRVAGFEFALTTWAQSAFGVDARVTLPVISLSLCDTQTTRYPRVPDVIEFLDRNKHRFRASGFLVTDVSAFQGSDSLLQNDETVLSLLGSMSLHGKDHGDVGAEGENRDYATQYADMAAAVDFLEDNFTRYKPVKASPDNSWNEATLHAMYDNGILYHSASIKKGPDYEALYKSLFDVDSELEREKMLARAVGGALRYYPLYHSDQTGEARVYSTDWYYAVCGAADPGYVEYAMRNHGLDFWIPILFGAHFCLPDSCGPTVNPTGWPVVMEVVIGAADQDSRSWRRWVDAYDYAQSVERFDRNVTVDEIDVTGDLIAYAISSDLPARFLTLKASRPGYVIESVSIDGSEYGYYGEDYVHLPELAGNMYVTVGLGTGAMPRPHVTHIDPSAVIEAAVIEDDRLSLTLSGEFDVACRLCGSSKVFAAGTTSVASNLTGSLTIDATHNQQVEQISLSLVPAHGSVAATPDYWHQDDITRREWTEWVSMQGIRVGHEAGDLQPAAGYMLMEDGCLVDSLYSDQSGVVTFTRTPPCSAASYQLLMDSSFARVDPEGQGPGRDEPSVTSLQIVTRPNPFGHGTTLSYQLPGDTEVTLGIYTVSGTLVRSLVDRRVEAGRHSVKWDCRDNRGSVVSAGVYVCRLTTPGRLKTCKLVVFR